jgi:nickel/cobalt transporter (NicO) family protein
MLEHFFAYLVEVQTWVREAITGYLDGFAKGQDWAGLLAVLPLGVFFGFVHSLTPGHGKLVLSSYLVGSRLSPLRGTAVAIALATTHVLSAVILALVAAPLMTRTLVGVGRAPLVEIVSRGLLALIGMWLLIRAIRGRPHVHGEGLIVGVTAGLIPCPLTFLTMFLAIARGIPQAGLTFALAMMLGIVLTLSIVAIGTVLARDAILRLLTTNKASFERISRSLDAFTGILLMTIGAYYLFRL